MTNTVSLIKTHTVFASPVDAMLGYFEAQRTLHNLLGSAASNAADITLAEIRMKITAGDYEQLSGRKLLDQANLAISAAFSSQDINRGNWRRKGLRLHRVNSDGLKIAA